MYELQHRAGLINGKKAPESSKALEARVAALEAKTEESRHESLFAVKKPKASKINNPAIERKGGRTRQSHADTCWLGLLKGNSQPSKQETVLLSLWPPFILWQLTLQFQAANQK